MSDPREQDPDESLVDPAAPVDDTSVAVEPTARQRLRRALLQPGPGQFTAAVLLCVLGIAAVTQVRVAGTDDEYAGMRQADLIQALNGLQASTRRAEQDISELQDTRDALRSNSDKTATALDQARKDLATLGVLAGTSAATGPGVRITVTLPASGISLNNLLDGIEELRDAGAEAMEINDAVRVVAQTSFETAPDGAVNVDGRVLTSPFVIDAIGDPESLNTALNFSGGFVDDVRLDDGKVKIVESQKIKVTVLRNPVPPQYAKPVE